MRGASVAASLVAASLLLGGCGSTGDEVTAADGTVPTGAATLAEAHAQASSVVDELVGVLPVKVRDRGDLDTPVVARCDETNPASDRTVGVTRGFTFAPQAADELLAAARDHLEARGVEGVRLLREDGDAPQLLGTYGDQAWQVSVLLGRSAGRGDVTVNSPCLPGDLEDET